MYTVVAVFLTFASALVAAQGGAESLSIPGYLPSDYVRALKPIGDDKPNDVYEHLRLRQPRLSSDEVVIYPHHFGFEFGVDPENSVYEITNAKELVARHSRKIGKKHHGKHGKQLQQQQHKHQHHHQQQHHQQQHQQQQQEAQASEQTSTYVAEESPRQFRPRPAYPPPSHG